MIKYDGYEIHLGRNINKIQIKTQCPKCKELGKTNYKDTCLSVSMDKKILNCHKCGWHGYFGELTKKDKIEFTKPDTKNFTELKLEHLQRFSNRGINQDILNRNKIKSVNDYIAFPYYEGDEIVNVKYKHYKEKSKCFQAKEGKQTMFKYNDIVNSNIIIVCEGEEDSLAWEEGGYLFATSVSQGAPNPNDVNIEKKLACIYNCFDIFEQAEWIYLSVDNDINGKRLTKELVKIFTAEKIKLVDHLDCKDANDILLKYGKDKFTELFENAKEIKQEGIYECLDFEIEIKDAYQNGQPRGTTTYFNELDIYWTHRAGEVTIWSGYNNEGKSLFLKQLLLIKSKHENWKHAVYSPEEMPFSEWYTDLIESYVGKSADLTQKQYNNYMTELQLQDAIQFMNKHFFSVYPNDEQSLDEILSRFSYLVRKKNIQTVVLDPYNQIQHKMIFGEREDLYISRFMSKLKKFAVEHNVSVHLVAHQVTPKFSANENYPEPNIYTIKGGGTFADKADNVVAVWREHRNTDIKNTDVKFISQKIKKQKLTGIPGNLILKYDKFKNRYFYNEFSPLENDIINEQKDFFTVPNFYEQLTNNRYEVEKDLPF